jgi:hypothetical protein
MEEIDMGQNMAMSVSNFRSFTSGETWEEGCERRASRLEEFSRYMHDKFIAGERASKPPISTDELECKMDDFTRIMQERFLAGEDTDHVDYVQIDCDAALDDYWLDEISQDAEDKYFEDD